jgi:enoyl-CoA hydratase/carnithine racemase
MTEELVLYESQDKIGLVTLNRPQKLNALSRDMRPALSAALRRADEEATNRGATTRSNFTTG